MGELMDIREEREKIGLIPCQFCGEFCYLGLGPPCTARLLSDQAEEAKNHHNQKEE